MSVCPQHAPSEPTLLTLSALRKQYGSRTILDIDYFAVRAAEAVLLVGSNGAGKSTLLRIMAGIDSADSGTLTLSSRPLTGNIQHRLRGRVIYLHQQPYLFDCSVRDNIGYGLRSLGIAADQRDTRIEQALEWSGLPHLGERHAKTLSGGEKQRIALARAWVLRPQLLLLDEPTANMDREACEQTYFLVRRLVSEGMAVVMTSHGIRNDHPMLTRTLLLQQGKLQPCGEAVTSPTPERQHLSHEAPQQSQRRFL
ncbi:energy-coupling factor ABC transporter ATP-binding protein [Motiliproteus sediminis]|uniref:energy-coupling factor ABC transporter ATP-binding protein n=1 Tax=Motiliproteus sediminis TaxID=1468178 RepID=UPI001AEFE9BB|nr:ABC transporter ATP-binding protein [Motiliproteus sediminis]